MKSGVKKEFSFNLFWQRYGTMMILLVLVVVLAVLRPQSIFSAQGITQILTQSTVNILMAMGVFFPILIAGTDLSAGSVVALASMLTAKMMVGGLPPAAALPLGVLIGGALGAINGLLINATGLHPFILTLGTQAIYRGVTIVISNSRSVFGFPASFTSAISGRVLGIPVTVLITLVVVIFMVFFTRKTRVGRNIYALGGNVQSAWYSGINVKLHTLLVFTLAGICYGIAGVVLLGRVGAAEPAAATGFETYAIAAAIIGGTSFFGGKGKIFGVVMGGLIIGLINYGMNVLTISSNYQQIVMGALIIISVTLERVIGGKK